MLLYLCLLILLFIFFLSSYLLISFILEFLPRKIRGLECIGRGNLVLVHDLASAIPSFWASKVALAVRNPPASAGDVDMTPGSGRPPGGGHGNPLQYSCPKNHVDRGAW